MALRRGQVSAEAQPTARSFAELIGIVKADETVVITDTRSRRVKGTLTSVDEDSLSLAADGRTQTFSRSEVSTVRVADGLGNGALIGAGAGLDGAGYPGRLLGLEDGYILPSAKVGAPLLLSGIGALAGALIDRAHEGAQFSMYRRPAAITAK